MNDIESQRVRFVIRVGACLYTLEEIVKGFDFVGFSDGLEKQVGKVQKGKMSLIASSEE